MTDLTAADEKEWLDLGAATVSDCLDRFPVLPARIRRVCGDDGLVGRAYCVRIMPGDSASLHLALDRVPQGRVLVVDAGAYQERAVWGEVLTVAAMRRGVIGIVVDGAVRDVAAIRRRGFPVYASSISPAGPHKSKGGHWGGTISCGGAVINDGDLIVADEDGVVVVPWQQHSEVLSSARQKVEQEGQWISEIERGRRSSELLGLTDQA